jgi:hypothetical protein
MTARRIVAIALACTAAAVPALALAQTQGPTESDTGADFFRTAILKDAKTTSAVKKLLQSNAGFIDPASQYGDLTGDGKPDAAVRVDTGGAAGAIALYVFTADGSDAGKLRIVYRNQQRYRVTAKITGSTLVLSEPVWAKGDDVCCPTKLREQDYVWRADDRTMRPDGPSRTTTR